MHKKRLLKLADMLEKDAKNKKGIKFSLQTWGRAYETDKPVSCGTYACAMGLAVASGAFRRAGLQPPSADGDLEPVLKAPKTRRRSYNYTAAARLFDIKTGDAKFLFSPLRYSSLEWTGATGELAVAARIRGFVAGNETP